MFNNLSEFLTGDIENNSQDENLDHTYQLQVELSDAAEAVEQATPEAQAGAYVCGFIFKKSHYKECVDCKNAFLCTDKEAIHIFTSFREYNPAHNSLIYVNKNAVQCVENLATIINEHLKSNGWRFNVKKNIMAALNGAVDFNFLNSCQKHFDYNVNHLKTCIFFISIKRFIILKNREVGQEEKKKSLERKIMILKNK